MMLPLGCRGSAQDTLIDVEVTADKSNGRNEAGTEETKDQTGTYNESGLFVHQKLA